MEKQFQFRTMSKQHKYLFYNICLTFVGQGMYMMLLGSELPLIKAEYRISYTVGGLLMSFQQIGLLICGLLISIPAKKLGGKKAYMIFGSLAFAGITIVMLTGNPVLLLLSMLMFGASKASTTYFGNQIVGNISGNSSFMLNLVNAFFALGAALAPAVALICGDNWRACFGITVAFGVFGILHASRACIGEEEYHTIPSGGDSGQTKSGNTLGFFREKLFWICVMMMLFYLSAEAGVMGWMTTYFSETGIMSLNRAKLLVTVMWIALLAGRFLTSALAKRFTNQQMLTVMSIGTILCYTGILFSRSAEGMTCSVIGLGLMMAGLYATIVASLGSLMERYPVCMSMMIAIPGVGSVMTTGLAGKIADMAGVRSGMFLFYGLFGCMMLLDLVLLGYLKKRR